MRWNGEIVKFKNVIVCVLSAGFLLTAASASAQTKPPAKASPPGNAAMDALFGLREFMQAEISPDGKRVAWVESLPGPGGAPSDNAAIYVAELSAPKAAKRITAAAELSAPKGAKRVAAGAGGKTACEEHDLAWSADGKRLAFLSDAAKTGQLQLYVADVSAGPAKQLTKLKGFLSTPGWSPNGKTIGVLFTENATRRAGPLVAETPDEGVVSEAFLEQRLALVD